MGTDCRLIAKVGEAYEVVVLDRFWVFQGAYAHEDFPFLNQDIDGNTRFSKDYQKMIKWCNEAIKHYGSKPDGADTDREYAMGWVNCVLTHIRDNLNRWDEIVICCDNSDDFLIDAKVISKTYP